MQELYWLFRRLLRRCLQERSRSYSHRQRDAALSLDQQYAPVVGINHIAEGDLGFEIAMSLLYL